MVAQCHAGGQFYEWMESQIVSFWAWGIRRHPQWFSAKALLPLRYSPEVWTYSEAALVFSYCRCFHWHGGWYQYVPYGSSWNHHWNWANALESWSSAWRRLSNQRTNWDLHAIFFIRHRCGEVHSSRLLPPIWDHPWWLRTTPEMFHPHQQDQSRWRTAAHGSFWWLKWRPWRASPSRSKTSTTTCTTTLGHAAMESFTRWRCSRNGRGRPRTVSPIILCERPLSPTSTSLTSSPHWSWLCWLGKWLQICVGRFSRCRSAHWSLPHSTAITTASHQWCSRLNPTSATPNAWQGSLHHSSYVRRSSSTTQSGICSFFGCSSSLQRCALLCGSSPSMWGSSTQWNWKMHYQDRTIWIWPRSTSSFGGWTGHHHQHSTQTYCARMGG